MNKSRTLVRLSKRVDPDLGFLMAKLEELGVPLAFTEELKEIYFTYLDTSLHGDYFKDRIRLSCGQDSVAYMVRTFIHELGHHVDDHEDISGRDSIVNEKRYRWKYLEKYARKNVGEYVACGFEMFYCGTPEQKRRMRRKNPKLWNVIQYLHRKHRSK